MTNLKELDGSPVNQIDDDDDVDRYVFIYYYIRTVKIIAYMPCEIISTANGIFVLYIPFKISTLHKAYRTYNHSLPAGVVHSMQR